MRVCVCVCVCVCVRLLLSLSLHKVRGENSTTVMQKEFDYLLGMALWSFTDEQVRVCVCVCVCVFMYSPTHLLVVYDSQVQQN